MSDLAPLLQGFFTDKLMLQRQASPNTVAAYRDTFTLLLGFVHTRTGRHPAQLSVADLDAPTIGKFLQHLETSRGSTASTRNARLAAIHSFFHYAVLRVPEHTALIQRVLSIPPKRFDRAIVNFLTRSETDALIAAPDKTIWTGLRDHALLLVAVHTGLGIYGAEYRGIVDYYLLAHDIRRLNRLHWAMETSMLKTLAGKHKSTVAKMADQDRDRLLGPYGEPILRQLPHGTGDDLHRDVLHAHCGKPDPAVVRRAARLDFRACVQEVVVPLVVRGDGHDFGACAEGWGHAFAPWSDLGTMAGAKA
jgi:integrase